MKYLAAAASKQAPLMAWASEDGRAESVLILALVGLVAGRILSRPLWQERSDLVNVPLAGLGALSELSALLSLSLSLLIFWFLLQPRRRRLSGVLLLLTITLLCAGDILRCQPWVYCYSALIAMLFWYSRGPGATAGGRAESMDRSAGLLAGLHGARLLIAGTYLYSGLQKITPEFGPDVLAWMLEPLDRQSSGTAAALTGPLSIAVPIGEVLLGLLLLVPGLRWLGIAGAILMHLLILALLGPFGHNWNSVVWPWNIVMILLLLTLFGGPAKWSTRELLLPKLRLQAWPQLLSILLFILLPLLSLWNLWPAYFSSALYCGNVDKGYVYIDSVARAALPETLQAQLSQSDFDRYELDIYAWCFKRLNTPPFPEPVAYLGIARGIEKQTHGAGKVSFTLVRRRLIGAPEHEVIRYSDSLLLEDPDKSNSETQRH